MQKITQITATAVPLLIDDVDTDRIIPARYLRCVTFDGLGEHVFEDDRKQDPAHPFNDPRYRSGEILIGGRNFGCGSSREHAPQALIRWGIKAVIAESFAEIFFGNCTSLGVPAVCVARSDLKQMVAAVQQNPDQKFTIDLEKLQMLYGKNAAPCTIPESARSALLSGNWDFLAQLLGNSGQIREAASRLPYLAAYK